MSNERRMVAFSIGVGGPEGLPYLSGAVNGAHQFYEWASKLGYRSHLVIDDEVPVTINRLKTELLTELEIQEPPIHRLVIYFAGHGLIREADEGLWLLSDWKTQLRAVAVEVLKRRLYRFNVGQIAIFADSCRSLPPSIDAADLTPDAVLGLGPNQRSDPPIDKFIAAQDGSATYMVPGETPDEDRCLFSGVLMEGLWGLSQSAFSIVLPGKVTSRSLGTFLKQEVPKRAAQYSRDLSPTVSPTFPDGDDIYFEEGVSITPPSFPPWPTVPSSTTSELDVHQEILVQGNRPAFNINGGPLVNESTNLEGGEIAREARSLQKLKTKRKMQHRRDAELWLLQKIRNQSRPREFETESGFAVDGGMVRNVWTRPDVVAERHGEPNWWRIRHRSSDRLLRSAPVLIELEDGTFGAATALPQFITTVLCETRGIAALIYRQINTPAEAAAAAEKAVAQLESGTLRADDATDLAAEIRQWKHFDPVLGAISAYLYDSIGDVESIRRMAYFYVKNQQPIPYDIALMGQLHGERRDDGLLSVLVPAVPARKPRTKQEKKHEWTHSATQQVMGEVGGQWPWMRQGWVFLDDPADDDSTLILPGLAELIRNLTNARFATLDAAGGLVLAKIFGLSPSDYRPIQSVMSQ